MLTLEISILFSSLTTIAIQSFFLIEEEAAVVLPREVQTYLNGHTFDCEFVCDVFDIHSCTNKRGNAYNCIITQACKIRVTRQISLLTTFLTEYLLRDECLALISSTIWLR